MLRVPVCRLARRVLLKSKFRASGINGGDGDRGHQKKPDELPLPVEHNFFNNLAHYPAGGSQYFGVIRCLVCKTARSRLSEGCIRSARRDSSPHLQCHSAVRHRFQPLNHLLRKQRVNTVDPLRGVRFEPPNPPERSPRWSRSGCAHTAIPARGLSAGRCHPAHKRRFCRFAKN